LGKLVLGVNNVWATKRFVEPEVWVEIVATKLEVGIVQFSFDLLDPENDRATLDESVTAISDSCDRYGVKIQSCLTGVLAYATNLLLHPYPSARQHALEWYRNATVLSRRFGVEVMGGHMGALSRRDYNNPQRRETLISELVDSVVSISRSAKEVNLQTLLWEPMPVPREPPSTMSEAKQLLDRANKNAPIPVRLCIDVGHECNPYSKDKLDRDPYAWLSELGKDSPCVHLQQTDGVGDRHWPFTETFNKPGIINGEQVIRALDRSGAAETYLYLEVIPPFEQADEQVIEDMKESVEYWKAYV
jgi:sugar phosphate isomerase/epimerase